MEGVVTYADLRNHVHRALSAEEATYGEFVDCSGATLNVSGDEIRQLASERQEVDERQRRPGPVAIVAPTDIFYGTFRMYDALTGEIRPIRVFREMRDAERWLQEVMGSSKAL